MDSVNLLSVFTDEALVAEVKRRGLVPARPAPTPEQVTDEMATLLVKGTVMLVDLWGELDGDLQAAFLRDCQDDDLWEAIEDKEHYGLQGSAVTAALESLHNAKREVQHAINELER